MRRFTTPTLKIKTNFRIADFDQVVLTLKQGETQLDFKKEEIAETNGTISVTLTQEQSASFSADSDISLQFRVLKDGIASASNIVTFPVFSVLKEGVLE